MSALNAAVLLSAWEQGVVQHPVERALTLLSLAWPENSAASWGQLTVGERDAHLLRLRDELFGSDLEATAICPRCDERLELDFSTRDLQPPDHEASLAGDPLLLQTDGYRIDYRVPTSFDLMEVANESPADAREQLLNRCVAVQKDGVRLEPATLPAALLETVMAKMAQADPLAEMQIAMDCPVCQNRWSMVFDIVSFLWGEIEEWAERLMREVHSLASVYGWSERDIIAMTARRRRFYLEMLGA